MVLRKQALIVVPLIISVLASAFGVLGYFMEIAFGMPSRLCMPPALRGVGVIVPGSRIPFHGLAVQVQETRRNPCLNLCDDAKVHQTDTAGRRIRPN